MTTENIQCLSADKLIELYERSAAKHAQATERGDVQGVNMAADRIAAIYHELRRRGAHCQSLLLPLLDSSNAGVRGWAGAHAMEFAPEQGLVVLETLSRQPGWLGFTATMTIKVWREGDLRFP